MQFLIFISCSVLNSVCISYW